MKIANILDRLLSFCTLFGLPCFWIVVISCVLFLNCEKNDQLNSYKEQTTIESNTSVNVYDQHKIDLLSFLSATQSADSAIRFDLDSFLSSTADLKQDNPVWPIHMFLLGEIYRLRENTTKALSVYRSLVEWAARDPYGDGRCGSGLASVALWRWIQELSMDSSPDPEMVNHMIKVAERLRASRLMRNMFNMPVLIAMPQLEEDIVRRMALVAWNAKQKKFTERFFLEYLTLSRTAQLGATEEEILRHLEDAGLASHDRLVLLRGKRLQKLRMFEEAYHLIKEARKSSNIQVRAEAGLHLANLELRLHERKKGIDRKEVTDLLESVFTDAADPYIAEKALYNKAKLWYREGIGRDTEQSEKDLLKLIDEFPRGQFADDALFDLTRQYQIKDDVETALHFFEKLQNFEGKNGWLGTGSFQMAMSLYTRGQEDDLKKASEILQKLDESNPYGPFHLIALFWLGRIEEETGNERQSKKYFEKIINQSPFDYYAIRARMHLHVGNQVKTKLVPDSEIYDSLRTEYKASHIDTSITASSPYHLRLLNALKTGLYERALAAEHRLLRDLDPPRRLENISLTELDEKGLLTHLSLLLALRQDALAAKDILPTSENRLQIAGAVEHFAKDYPLVMQLVIANGEPYPSRWAAQTDKRYLATAYPAVYKESILKASQERNVPPQLLYAIMRQESNFYTAALSHSNALGLFQFIPNIFNNLDKEWKLLQSTGIKSREEFLLNPDLSIDLGARFFKEELLKRQRGSILLAIMEHNAGNAAVGEWVKRWKDLGRDDDVEYMIETFRFAQTRIFARKVLTDMIIIDASNTLNPDGNI
jgi:tetratricopeptide (TPR) repeat protein